MYHLQGILSNCFIKPANAKYNTPEEPKLQILHSYIAENGDTRQELVDVTTTEEGFKFCHGQLGREISVPCRLSAVESKIYVKPIPGTVPKFVAPPAAATASAK